MPTVRIPLVGSFNTRGIDGNNTLTLSEDQQFLNCTFNTVQNPVTGRTTLYCERRPGWGQDSVVSTGIASTGLIRPQAFNAVMTAFGETNSAVYVGTISVGNITGRALHFTETLISASSYVLLKSSDGTGWYYPNGAKDQTAYIGNTSSGGTTVSSIPSTAGMYPGQLLTGPQMGAGARISTVPTSSTITMTVAATAASTSTAITKEPIAKILSANFLASTTYVSAFAPMDGYVFYATDDGYINNSDLNSVTAYSANARLAVQQSPDPPVAVATQKNALVVLGTASKEVFQNVGLSSGSPLQRVTQAAEKIGCLDQRSVTSIEDDIYFVATPYEGDVGVYRLRGLASTRVSTPNIDRILGSISAGGAIYAASFRLGGYAYASFVVSLASDGPASMLLLESGDIVLLESDEYILLEDTPAQSASFVRMLVYNVNLNVWSEWDCNQATFIDGVSVGSANQIVATSRMNTSGKVYTINPASQGGLWQDDSSTYSMQVRTSGIDLGTSYKKYVRSISLITDRPSAGTALLEKSDDDYQTWQTLGTFDLSKARPDITRCGAHFGRRAYRLTHSYNGPFRAEAIEIDYDKGLA